METAEMDALFAQTLIGDYDGDEPWAAIDALRKDSSREIFELRRFLIITHQDLRCVM
jgi:hypothetical protein